MRFVQRSKNRQPLAPTPGFWHMVYQKPEQGLTIMSTHANTASNLASRADSGFLAVVKAWLSSLFATGGATDDRDNGVWTSGARGL